MTVISLTGADLSLEHLHAIAVGGGVQVAITAEAVAAMTVSREFLETRLEGGDAVYGLNTGFGRMAETRIDTEDLAALQVNLVRSHASGTGALLPVPEVRAIMALRANALAAGHSGCRPDVPQRIVDFLNRSLHPAVPQMGSVGASGDLGPLAHIALALIGEGEFVGRSGLEPVDLRLQELDVSPLRLAAKEGLALINGTQATTAIGALALHGALVALEGAEVAGAMSLEALRGTPDPFRPEIHRVRPHPGQRTSAERLLALLADSEIRESHRSEDPRVQDAYSLRCMPQVHGATRDALGYVHRVVETEMNSVTDNPLVFAESELVLSGGNFHAQVVSAALDFLAVAVADLASISERRIERMLNPDLSDLPAFLTEEPGLHSGFMIAQVTAADLLSEMRVAAHPASVDSVSTNAAREDHVSMGMAAARKARRSVDCLQRVIAIELLCAAQGLEFRRPLRSGAGVERAHALIRARVPRLAGDRPLSRDIDIVRDLLESGAFLDVWNGP